MSKLEHYNFYTAKSHLNDLYGIDMSSDDFEAVGYTAWKHIGNRDCRMYKGKLFPQPDLDGGWFAPIPCNCDIIEAITTNYEDSSSTSNITNNVSNYRLDSEHFAEVSKTDLSGMYISGKLVNYKRLGDNIYFNEPYTELNILYKGIYTDEDGLPYLNFKEVDAIAMYCAYTHFFKKSLKTMDANTAQMAALLNAGWQKKCSLAKTPDYFSQNEMNSILDAHTSWDRKQFGSSFKPVNK